MSDEDTATVSVVVPVLDGAGVIAGCLATLGEALPEGGEIIVVDDGSADDTAEITARFPVRLLRHDRNRGTSASRNSGAAVARGALLCFVDADIVVRPDTLRRMVALLEAEPALVGVNALLDPELHGVGLVTDFTNLSIHYQHLRHGPRVRGAFTSTCLLRREAYDAMGGWDERWSSRYADDVVTRFHLDLPLIAMDPGILVSHDKPVRLLGLLKHRANIGYFFVLSCAAFRHRLVRRPGLAVMDLRYPANTVAAACYLLLGIATLCWGPLVAPLWLVPLALTGLVNARFTLFTLRHRGLRQAAVATPLSALEGFLFLGGMLAGLRTLGRERL